MPPKITVADLAPVKIDDLPKEQLPPNMALQLRVPNEVGRAFKRAALERDMKLNSFMVHVFQEWQIANGEPLAGARMVDADGEPVPSFIGTVSGPPATTEQDPAALAETIAEAAPAEPAPAPAGAPRKRRMARG